MCEEKDNALFKVIMTAVGEQFGVSIKDLLGHSRERTFVEARQVSMYLCYEFTHWSAQKVGERFACDPTYVLHAVSVVKARMEADKEFARIVVSLADGFEEISRPLNTSANGESASPMQQGRYKTTLPIGDILDDVFRATSSEARRLGTHGLRAGLEAIDELFGDLPYGETISVVGCDDAVAAVLHTVARNAALKGASVLYCTRGSARREALAIASALSHVPLDCLQDGSYNKGEARAFDFAIQEIKKWDIRFVEYDDSSDDFLTDLYRSIAQEFNLGETFKGTPRLIVVDSLLDKKTEGWKSAPIAEAAYLFDRITAQWRATLMFGLVGSHLKGGILGSSIPDLVYSMIELREFGEGERLIRPRITVAGGGVCAE
ncbi:helix-turn-helix domain-containing protein [Adlercreutzia caecimuris]|uniref:helix-turn-helix domain-containing protein n=1 Tax=Adlercreutzia caecimuris TaxID=671266 RepID=UPI00272A1F5A|nr:helix-turn-helix domain-containing protein [Adlercreutzia caecimuris]